MLTHILNIGSSMGNVTYMFLSTILVFVMTPGLAFFYGGLVQKKNSLTIMLQVFLAIGVVGLLWIFGGFSLVFGKDIGGVIGNPAQFFAFHNLLFDINHQYGAAIPFILFFMYQLMFAIITLPLMTGAAADRLTIGGWIKFLICWMILVYFPVAHWIWGGGFLEKMGFVDFAGGTVIHVSAAFTGLAAILYLGKRIEHNKNRQKPFNLGLVAVGAGLLLFGWFGFNAGGTLNASDKAAIIITNTAVASIAAMVLWTIIAYFNDGHKFSFTEPLVGAVAGLATITPASGYVKPSGALIIGLLSAIVCFACVKFADKMHWDDALDVWGVHGMGGLLGTVMIGCFADPVINSIHAGWHQIGIQLFGAVLVAVYAMIVTFVILYILDHITQIRTTKEQQIEGLDKTLLNQTYDGKED